MTSFLFVFLDAMLKFALGRVLLLFVIWGFFGVSLANANKAYQKGRRYYRAYQFARAVTSLKRALKASARWPRQRRLQLHLMLAISQYNLTRSADAARHFREALQIDRATAVPPGQSPPAVAFFRNVRRKFLRESKPPKPPLRRAKPFVFSPQPRRPKPRILTPVGVRENGPSGRRVALVKQPRQLGFPKQHKSVWQRHRISIITGAVGIAVLGVGVGLAVAFQGEAAQLNELRGNPNASGELVHTLYQRSEGLVIPANVMLISGGVIAVGAVGVFIAEWLIHRRSQSKTTK